MSTTIAIGRRTVEQTAFENAVNISRNWRQVCRALGFNEKVGTTVRNVQEQAQLLKLNTSHFGYQGEYNTPPNRKEYNIIPKNRIYFDSFKEYAVTAFKRDSLSSYNSCAGRFFEHLADKELATIGSQEIDTFCEGKKNTINLVKSILMYLLKNNVNGIADKCNRELYKWVIGNS